jgi:hypothetical protein
MFDPSKFDLLIRKAKEFDSIMKKYDTNFGFSAIEFALQQMTKFSKEAKTLERIISDIKGDFKTIALEQAKMTRAELEAATKHRNRAILMDRMLMSIKATNKELRLEYEQSKKTTDTIKKRMQMESQLLALQMNNLKQAEKLYESQLQDSKTVKDKLDAQGALLDIQNQITESKQKELDLQFKYLSTLTSEEEKRKKIKKSYKAGKDAAGEVPGMRNANEAARLAEMRHRRVKFLKQMGGNVMNPMLDEVGLGGLKVLMGGLGAVILGLSVLVGMVLTRIIKDAIDTFKDLKNSGLTAAQTLTAFGDVGTVLSEGISQGVLGTRQDFGKAFTGQSKEFGTIDLARLGHQSVIDATEMARSYGLSAEDAARLTRNLGRANGYNQQLTHGTYEIAKAFARVNKLNPADMMKDMASNTELFARFADRGSQSLLTALARARQMGVAIESTEGFANRMVDDFEGSLRMQAELQTIIPGIDLSAVQYAAQFGTAADVQTELQKSFSGAGLGSLSNAPRSIQNLVSRATGISLADIQGLSRTGPQAPGMQTFVTPGLSDLDTAAMKAANTLLALSVNGDALMAGIRTTEYGVTPTKSSITAGIPGYLHHSGGIVNGLGPSRLVASSAFASAPRFHSGFMPDEVPAILQRGEAVLSRPQLRGLTKIMNLTALMSAVSQTISPDGMSLSNGSSTSTIFRILLLHLLQVSKDYFGN